MRLLATLEDRDKADRFAAYLLTIDIDQNLDESRHSGWELWVLADDDLDRAKDAFAHFEANPDDPRYGHATQKQARRIRKEQTEKQKKLAQNFVDMRTRRSGAHSSGAKGLTLTLIAACIVVAIATKIGADRNALIPLLFIPELVFQGQVWRILTPIFIHFGPLHLIFNMFWLWDLGRAIEGNKGTLRLGIIILASAVISNTAQSIVGDNILFGGFSGVIFALFGYVWFSGKYRPQDGLGVQQQTVWIMMAWLVICFTGFVGPIANTAHVVGLLCGTAWIWIPHQIKTLRKQS